jgi:PIN domain nuclease of toxin-antitoxin system
MRILLDTHAFLWWLDGDSRLTKKAKQLIAKEDTVVLVSAASAWEITTKFRIGKLPGATEVAWDIRRCLTSQGFESLPITLDHAQGPDYCPVLTVIPLIECLSLNPKPRTCPSSASKPFLMTTAYDGFGKGSRSGFKKLFPGAGLHPR